ncbi:MAG: hypothetical protein P4L79_06115 [Legionella sp.]|uniref:hypothetical protein n=1 Tax=Legionella sp. TaxID=459 RepID=UPI0028451F07|nr:hypothetical protein [Legionella sp.]
MKLNELLDAITKQWKQQIVDINIRLNHAINGKSMSNIQAEALIKEYETLYNHFVNYTYSMALACKEQVLENDLEKYIQGLKKEVLHTIGLISNYRRINTELQNAITQSKPNEQRATPKQSPVSRNDIVLAQPQTSQQERMQAPSPVRRNHFFQPGQSIVQPLLRDNLSQPIQLAQKTAPAVPMPTFDEQYEAREIFPHDPENYPQYYICNF